MTTELIITLGVVILSNIAGWVISYNRSTAKNRELVAKECAVLATEVQNMKKILSNGLSEKLDRTSEATNTLQPMVEYLMNCKLKGDE